MSDINEMNVGTRWYVAHTYSGYENKVKTSLEKIIENRNLGHLIFDIKIPVETIIEKNGDVEKEVEVKIFPSYVLIKMVMTDESWYVVRNTRGCTGFVGPGSKPVPLSEAEVERLGVETVSVDLGVDVGDTVRITDGSMEGFMGEVLEINNEKRKVSVMVTMFGGREMQVEFDFYQIEPLD